MTDSQHYTDSRFVLDGAQRDALRTAPKSAPISASCDIAPEDGVAVYRNGAPGSAYDGRVTIDVRVSGEVGRVLLNVKHARIIAAAILTAADELDGTTPLVFHPRAKVEEADLDDPAVSADVEPEEFGYTVEPATPSILSLLGGLVRKVVGK